MFDKAPEPIERWHSGSYKLDKILGGITLDEWLDKQGFPEKVMASFVEGAEDIGPHNEFNWQSPFEEGYTYPDFIEEVMETAGYGEEAIEGYLDEKGITYDEFTNRLLENKGFEDEAVWEVLDKRDVPKSEWADYILAVKGITRDQFGHGWPRGRMVTVFGPASSGKTTVALHAVQEAQDIGLTTAFIDAEHAVDPNYAFDGIGVDRKAMIFQQPDSAEKALDTVEAMVDEGIDVIVIDSVSALVPEAELESEHGDNHVGLQARLLHKTMRKLVGKVSQQNCTVIWINQIRKKVGVMFGSDETTSGGQATKFYPSIRLRLSPSKHQKDGKETVGNKVNARTVKNKTDSPFKKTKLMITYGIGLDKAAELAHAAENVGAIEKAGSWYKLMGQTICQGMDALTDLIKSDSSFRERLEARVDAIKDGEIQPGEPLPEGLQL
jgi:recombination protein RecA